MRPGETLIGISRDLLENPRDWTRLQRLNKVADPRLLRPGTVLRIPLTLLRREPVTARVTAIRGDVSAGGKPLTVGGTVERGSQLTTGPQSFATVELVDGSRLVLQPSSRLKVEEMSRYRNSTLPETRLRLDTGRIESVVTRMSAPRPQYIVVTPTATIGVRGTQFRVGADDTGATSRTEVTDGAVGVLDGQGRGKPASVPAGYGLVAEAGGRLSAPVALLPAPELAGLPKLQERTIVRLAVPSIGGASAYRFQVGTDAEMRNVLAESIGARPEAKFAELADGGYTLRVRGIDARGLEGRDADFAFTLKARPEPPFAVAPVAGTKLRGESAELKWSANAEAARYRIQLASDAKFANPVTDVDGVDGTVIMPAQKLAPGDYYWRARSLRANGEPGPWGDAQRFTLKPLPCRPGAAAGERRPDRLRLVRRARPDLPVPVRPGREICRSGGRAATRPALDQAAPTGGRHLLHACPRHRPGRFRRAIHQPSADRNSHPVAALVDAPDSRPAASCGIADAATAPAHPGGMDTADRCSGAGRGHGGLAGLVVAG